jgi:alpha-glucosidase
MVWDGGNASSGFSTGKPWLPIKEPQARRHAAGQAGDPESVLALYRKMLRLRRETEELRVGRTRFFDVEEPVLAFTRGGTVLCVFNLSPEKHEVVLKGGGAMALTQGAEHKGERLVLHPNGFAIMAATGKTEVADVPAGRARRAGRA